MLREDEKVEPSDIPREFDHDDVCTITIDRETGLVELRAMDLEIMEPDGTPIGTISLSDNGTGQPIAIIPLCMFAWTWIPPKKEETSHGQVPDLPSESAVG